MLRLLHQLRLLVRLDLANLLGQLLLRLHQLRQSHLSVLELRQVLLVPASQSHLLDLQFLVGLVNP
jgi:hypothetical protein